MKCAYIKTNGQQCQANAKKDSGYCFSHDPESKDAHQLAVVKGGQAKKRKELDLPAVVTRTPQDVVSLLEETINLVRNGTIDPALGNSLGFLCSHLLKAMEAANLDDRLEMVESVLLERKTVKKGRGR